jgi:DNA polymerase III delta prime subunit
MLSEANEFEHEIKEINKIKDKIKFQTLDRAITEMIKSKAEIASQKTVELNNEYLEIIAHLDEAIYKRLNK